SQGESGKTDDGNFPQQRARDYEAVFAALKLKNVILVGWSQGVQDVTSYVAEFGTTRLAGVVLVDAAVSKGAASVSSNPKFVQSVLGNMDIYAKHKRDYLEGMMHAIFSQPMPDADFKALVDTGMKTPTNTGIAELNADMLGADLTPALKKFDKPTLIVASSASFELVGQKAEVSALPHGSFTQIDHAAHGVFVDQPDAFNRILAGFIKKI
ncbi:MAG: alpha/beta fold hydrolase, partial [Rhizomicrobium sp.]